VRVLGTVPGERRPDATIAKMAAALADMPEDVLKLAETEVGSWQHAMQNS